MTTMSTSDLNATISSGARLVQSNTVATSPVLEWEQAEAVILDINIEAALHFTGGLYEFFADHV